MSDSRAKQEMVVPTFSRQRSPRPGYVLAFIVAVVGVVAAVVYALAAQAAMSNRADGFVRTAVPGTITVHVDRTATYYVYVEGAISLHPSVQVTDPQGRVVAVGGTSVGPHYYHGGNGGAAVGRFNALQTGDFRVSVSTGSTVQGDFAVGGQFPLWLRLSDATSWTLLVLFMGSGLGLAVATAIRRRRAAAQHD